MKNTIERRIEFLGCPLDCMTSVDLLDELKVAIVEKLPPRVIQFVNANKVAMVRKDPAIGSVLARTDYVLADGQPMLPMAAMLGYRIPERIDGIGLMQKLLGLADREHFSVYLLGARQEILEECVRRIGVAYPGLHVAGWHNGYFSESEIPAIAAEIRRKSPDFLFLGIGSPMKELLADEWRNHLGSRVIQGVGGSFDVMAGLVKRAPRWMQRSGIEWLYRIIQEPRRMFWRYVRTNGACLWIFFVEFGRRWFGLPRPVLILPEIGTRALRGLPMNPGVLESLRPRLLGTSRQVLNGEPTKVRSGARPFASSYIAKPEPGSAICNFRRPRVTAPRYRRGGRSVGAHRQPLGR